MKIQFIHKTRDEVITAEKSNAKLDSLLDIPVKDLHHSLAWLQASEIFSAHNKRIFIYEIFIKSSTIPVFINSSGLFYYESSTGEEIVLDKESYAWIANGSNLYDEKILENLDYRMIEVNLIDE